MTVSVDSLKNQVSNYWNAQSCGEVYADGHTTQSYYDSHAQARYDLEPYIISFAKFSEGRNKDVLEVGVGMGADHLEWAKSCPRSLRGVDITPRAVQHTTRRFEAYNLKADVMVADAEALPFESNSFDIVYSWGVLHHSPNTEAGINEVLRVLRPGGTARVMIYNKYSLIGYMLWIRYALLTGRLSLGLTNIYADYLESPGTKAFTTYEADSMFKGFSHFRANVQLSIGDLLEGNAGQRHSGLALKLARRVFPRLLISRLMKDHGLFMMIEAIK